MCTQPDLFARTPYFSAICGLPVMPVLRRGASSLSPHLGHARPSFRIQRVTGAGAGRGEGPPGLGQGGGCLGIQPSVTIGNASCVGPRALTLPNLAWESELKVHTVHPQPFPLLGSQPPPPQEIRSQGLPGFGLPARQPLGGALEP